MSDSLWSIYNRAEEVRVDGLHAFQLKWLLKSFSPTAFSNWLIWQEGWVDWQELDEVIDSLFPDVRLQVSEKSRASSVPQMQPNSGVIAEQSPLTYAQYDLELMQSNRLEQIAEQIASEAKQAQKHPEVPQTHDAELLESSLKLVETPMPKAEAPLKKEERRANSRFNVPIKLFLHIDGSVLKNETSDISMGGMKLKTPLIKEPKASFDVTLLHQGTELALRCRLMASEGEAKSRLLIEKCNRIEILRSWIVEPKSDIKKESA